MNKLWGLMLAEDKPAAHRGYLWEPYLRRFLAAEQEVDARKAVGKTKMNDEIIHKMKVGGCKRMAVVSDVVSSVRDSPEDYILFHSVSVSKKLFDCIYRADNKYYAFNATVAKSHSCNLSHIDELVDGLQLKEGQSVELIYAVPFNNFKSFLTDPVHPLKSECPVTVIGIPKPDQYRSE